MKLLKYIFILLFFVIGFSLAIFIGIGYFLCQYNKEYLHSRLGRYYSIMMKEEKPTSEDDYILGGGVVDIPSRIYDKDGELIGEFYSQRRIILSPKEIPDVIKKAVVAAEDRDFYHHIGISIKGMIRALFYNLISGEIKQGGSTITQQLIKQLFTTGKRTFGRKIYEIFCALEVEKYYSKDDILSMYLNLVYFGSGAYGVGEAARTFFHKDASQLTIGEASLLAGLISNPKKYSPFLHPKNAKRKQKAVLEAMAELGYIKKEDIPKILKKFWKRHKVFKKGEALVRMRINKAPYFIEHIRRLLVDVIGETALKKEGLRIYTTLDLEKQEYARKSLRWGIDKQREYHLKRAKKYKQENKISLYHKELLKAKTVNGAIISIDPYTGYIEAMVGGYKFSRKDQFNRAVQAKRQPGSAFKPIIYASAIESREFTPATSFIDEKTTFIQNGKKYSPANYDNYYRGEVVLCDALKMSINTVSVKLLDMLGYSAVFSYINKAFLGKIDVERRFGRHLSLALGTSEVTPLELARLIAPIVNYGKAIIPFSIRYITDYKGRIIYDLESKIKDELAKLEDMGVRDVISPQTSYIMIWMMRRVFDKGGTAYPIKERFHINFDVIGKTGTSSDFRDAWFVGATSNLLTVVWIGNDIAKRSLGQKRSGGVVAAPVWALYTHQIYLHKSPPPFKKPATGIVEKDICAQSGFLPLDTCPKVIKNVPFIEGTEPKEYCPIHQGGSPLEQQNFIKQEKENILP